MPRRVQKPALTALTFVLGVLLCLAGAASGAAITSPTKTASGDFFGPELFRAEEIVAETLQPRRGEAASLTKIASGRRCWLSPDPLGEAGGINLYGYVRNHPISSWDPFGLAPHCDFTGGLTEDGRKSNSIASYAKNIEPQQGEFTFFGHGHPSFVVDTRGVDKNKYAGGAYTPEALDKYMRKNHKEDWENAERITLHSCSAGKGDNSFAQRLADLTGKPVTAPTKDLWTGNGVIADPKRGVFPSVPDMNNQGEWGTFEPAD